jgi:hypothetical protein
MSQRRVRTEEVLVFLGVTDRRAFLERLRAEGLFESEEIEPEEADDLRLAHVLMDELGVNAAGVEVVLHLRKRLFALEERARTLAGVLESTRKRG